MKIRTLAALLLCCFIYTPIWAQERSAQQLHLKTGVYDCPENLTDFINAPFRADELRKGAYYRILQFSELPTSDEHRAMADAGIDLRTYIPRNAFQARISAEAELSQMASWGVRSVMTWDARYKMTNALANEDFPTHAMAGRDRILLSVIFQPDFQTNEVIAL